MRDLQPYLINPVRRDAERHLQKESKKVAKNKKRRKLAGAALQAHRAKVAKKSAKKAYKRVMEPKKRRKAAPVARKASRKSRAKHWVTRHHRKGGRVHSYSRKGANVKRHLSNPFGLGRIGSTTMEALTAVGVLLGTIFVAGFVNRQVQRIPQLQAGIPNLLAKVGVAVGLTMVASRFIRSRDLQKVVVAGAFVSPSLSALALFAPGIAAQMTLAEGDENSHPGEITADNRVRDELDEPAPADDAIKNLKTGGEQNSQRQQRNDTLRLKPIFNRSGKKPCRECRQNRSSRGARSRYQSAGPSKERCDNTEHGRTENSGQGTLPGIFGSQCRIDEYPEGNG